MAGFQKEDSSWLIFTAVFAVWVYLVNAPLAGDVIPLARVLGPIASGMILALTPWAIIKLFLRSRRGPADNGELS